MRVLLLVCAMVVTGPAFGSEPQGETELVRERYASRKVKIQRHVTLDDEGNYINHGAWKWWTEAGSLRAAGEYRHSLRHGSWTQWLDRGDAEMLSQPPFNNFQAPFTSHAQFREGQLDGTWMIFDSGQRQCAEIELAGGTRHGKTTLWHRSGQVYYRAEFDRGALVGHLQQTNPSGELRLVGQYLAGRRVFTRTSHDQAGQKLAEASFLGPRTEVTRQDDFWRLSLAEIAERGTELRHGPHRTWYPSGQQRHVAQFEENQLSGPARWWHANGQPATTGHYAEGQAAGRWTWWHENGIKAAHVAFSAGLPTGEAIVWDPTGRRLPAGKLALREPASELANQPAKPAIK